MQVSVEKTSIDPVRLFLTFRRKPENYEEVRLMFVGEDIKVSFLKSIRGRLIFLAATAFIAAVSSVFSYFTEHYDSLIAIWLIWLGNLIVFSIWMFIDYKGSYSIYQKNKQFFQDFEACAQVCEELPDFERCYEQK